MKLAKLIIDNFKGIRHFVLDAGEKSVTILGANGTGKTSVADAYFWLLFGKDSLGNTKFTLKTNGTSGLDYSVEALLVDDRLPYDNEFTLRRVLREQWTKKRGESDRKLTGNFTEYYIDGVPKSESEYNRFIAGICPEDQFRLLTDPDYFAGKLKWQDQLDMLLKSFGGSVNDREVIDAYRDELGALYDLIKMKSVSDYELVAKAERKKINDRLHDIPVAIAATQDAIPPDVPENLAPFFPRREKLRLQRQDVERKIIALQDGGEIVALQAALQSAMATREKARAEYYAAQASNSSDTSKLRLLRADHGKLESKLVSAKVELNQRTADLKGESQKLQKLRDEYDKAVAEHYSGSGTCPTCRQALPHEMIEKAKGNWNANHAKSLQMLISDGKECSCRVDQLETEISQLNDRISNMNQQLSVLDAQISALEKAVSLLVPFESSAEAVKCQSAIDQCHEKISVARNNSATMIADVSAQLSPIDAQIAEIDKLVAAADQAKGCTSRIAQLEAEEKDLGAKLSEIDAGLMLAEKFTLRRAEYVQQKVNSAFHSVEWKLYDVQINGGIKSTCVATVGGVPYTDGLNTAAKLNAGLDIIGAFASRLGFTVPIWIDNSESVTDIKAPDDAQMICLQVSAEDRKIRTEVWE